MRSILIIPIKQYSERISSKNFRLVQGKPLYQWMPGTCQQASVFERIVLDTDSLEIMEWAKQQGLDVLTRLPQLASNEANGNDLLRHHVQIFPGYDLYWQGFVTSPYLSVTTVRNLYRQLLKGVQHGQWDSVLTVEECKGAYWQPGSQGYPVPVNHRPELMPRSQDLPVLYREVCGLFGVTAKGFNRSGTRAGAQPYPYVLPRDECLDIDWPDDLPVGSHTPGSG